MGLTWETGEVEWLDEPDPELEALAALDRLNDRFVIVVSGEAE
jgi:hypothetical protein